MGNKRRRRSRRVESQSSDRDENTSETSFTQGNATLVGVSENVNSVLDRNLGSELTEPSQISNEIEVISQRLTEQNNDKMSQIEEQLNNKFEEILKEVRTNKNHIAITDEEDAENNQPGPSNYRNKGLRNKHASGTTSDKNKNQDDRFYPSEMCELRQPYTPLGIVEDTLDETIIINENRQERADHHTINHVFRSMTVQELNTLHTICELERNQRLTILAMSVQNPQLAGFLLTGNRSNFLYVEGSTAWLYDCPHFLSPLYKADRCFDRIPIHFKDTLMYVDPITRQTYDYATPVTCDNNPRNIIELDPDSEDQDFYILGPEPIKRKPPLMFTPSQIKTTIRPITFTAQDAGIYSNAELDQFWNRILFLNSLTLHFKY